jgi:hypothetical protein
LHGLIDSLPTLTKNVIKLVEPARMTPESKCETPVALAKALAKFQKNGGAVIQEKLMNFPGILKIGITYPQTMQVSVEEIYDLLNNVHATRVDQRFDFVSWPKLSDHTHLSSLGYGWLSRSSLRY